MFDFIGSNHEKLTNIRVCHVRAIRSLSNVNNYLSGSFILWYGLQKRQSHCHRHSRVFRGYLKGNGYPSVMNHSFMSNLLKILGLIHVQSVEHFGTRKKSIHSSNDPSLFVLCSDDTESVPATGSEDSAKTTRKPAISPSVLEASNRALSFRSGT